MESSSSVFLIGLVLVATILVRRGLGRSVVPPMVGYLAIGFLLRAVAEPAGLLTEPARHGIDLMANVGVVLLLFRVGLESDPPGLLRQLRRALPIWAGNVGLSLLLAFLVAWVVLDLALVPSAFAAVACSATSVGVALGVWRDRGVARTDDGLLLIDVAELDDLSSVALVAMLVAILPALDGNGPAGGALLLAGGKFLVSAAAFAAFCIVFSKYVEPRLTEAFHRRVGRSDAVLLIAAVGLIIAAAAGMLHFSLAVGAFFAGLTFSRDPEAVRLDAALDLLDRMFIPFFFVGVGAHVHPDALLSAPAVGLWLLGAAIVGKLAGGGLPALAVTTPTSAWLIGMSLVPRAEIAMIVMEEGRRLGPEVVPPDLYAGMVVVSAGTCVLAPLVVGPRLGRPTAS